MNGKPFIPYGRQIIDDSDLEAVANVLRGDWLTTGPEVTAFEEEFAEYAGAKYAVAVSNGTAALHLAMLAADVGPGDEVIVPALTFVATANAVRYVGAHVRFADVDPRSFVIDPASVEALVTPRTKAIVAVDYGGLPCDYDALRAIADRNRLILIEDACHAPGATYRGQRVGSIADLTAFSFHPVKHLTTGEGGMVTTESSEYASSVQMLRSHGIATDFRGREALGTWEYDQTKLGYNYRIADINCALGRTQLKKQSGWVQSRREIAKRYQEALADVPSLALQLEPEERNSSWHLFPVRVIGENANELRSRVFQNMRADGIGVNVHYRPVYLNSYYVDLGYKEGICPKAEALYEGLLSLPMWPGLELEAQDRVVSSLKHALDS